MLKFPKKMRKKSFEMFYSKFIFLNNNLLNLIYYRALNWTTHILTSYFLHINMSYFIINPSEDRMEPNLAIYIIKKEICKRLDRSVGIATLQH